jgi:hypothetical protein
MDSTVLLSGAAILVAWIMLTMLAKERQTRMQEQVAQQRAADDAAKLALPEPAKTAPANTRKAA